MRTKASGRRVTVRASFPRTRPAWPRARTACIAALVVIAFLAGSGRPAGAVPPLRTFACTPVEGLRTDSLSRALFLDAFTATLGGGTLRVTQPNRRGGSDTLDYESRFRPAYTENDEQAWSMRVVVILPPLATASHDEFVQEGRQTVRRTVTHANPRRRRSRRIGVSVAILSPAERVGGAEAELITYSVIFPAPPAPDGGMLVPNRGGYELPWEQAGRAAALLALETLHHHSGDLPVSARVDVTPVLRADAPE